MTDEQDGANYFNEPSPECRTRSDHNTMGEKAHQVKGSKSAVLSNNSFLG